LGCRKTESNYRNSGQQVSVGTNVGTARIERVEAKLVTLAPKTLRRDAIQTFVAQETPILHISCSDGSEGVGYSYTIGTGGSSIMSLLKAHLAPLLIGRDPDCIEAIWRDLIFHTHATHVGAVTSLALAAIDTALWDRRARVSNLPLWKLLGGANERIPTYTTEGGWLHLSPSEVVENVQSASQAGFLGAKIKIGRRTAAEDQEVLLAVRAKAGDRFELMVDANQAFRLDEAIKRMRTLEEIGLAWIEEPLPADDLSGHRALCARARVPIAVGESLYSIGQFGDYVQNGACHIVQVDVARVGGVTPWLKVAHLAECRNLTVCPHFLMELHVSLACATQAARWVEHMPQLDDIIASPIRIENGYAYPPTRAGLGIDWDWDRVGSLATSSFEVCKSFR
jgi:L-alanine-DL-glutamate epimerase-like enolase superfamily enzyme